MVRPRLVLLIVAIAGAPVPAEGQRDSSASQVAAIAGTVSDAATHEPLADVRIQLEGTKLGALSGIDGRYRLTAVRPGAYALSARRLGYVKATQRSEEHTSELQSPCNLVCRLLLGKKKSPHQLLILAR